MHTCLVNEDATEESKEYTQYSRSIVLLLWLSAFPVFIPKSYTFVGNINIWIFILPKNVHDIEINTENADNERHDTIDLMHCVYSLLSSNASLEFFSYVSVSHLVLTPPPKKS